MLMDNKDLEMQEEESSIVTFVDENGEDCDFEFLDSIDYEGKEYIVLTPAEEDAAEIIILEVQPIDEENEEFVTISDDDLLQTVYGIFKERNKDLYTFGD